MTRRGLLWAAVIALAAAALLAGADFILRRAGQRTDSHPPGSTLRADALGAAVLHGAFGRMPGVASTRNLAPLQHITGGPGKTLFLLGEPNGYFRKKEVDALTRFAGAGGRVVVALAPVMSRDQFDTFTRNPFEPEEEEAKPDKEKKGEKGEKEKEKKATPFPEPEGEKWVTLFSEWGVTPVFDMPGDGKGRSGPEGEKPPVEYPVNAAPGYGDILPPVLKWHGGVHFRIKEGEWTPVYLRGGPVKPAAPPSESNPLKFLAGWLSGLADGGAARAAEAAAVVVERGEGAGTIVLASDSYLASNEAMRADRKPRLLAWLAGPADTVIFDETHLGIRDATGVAGLMARHRLAGFAVAALVVALLCVWRGASSLGPRRDPVEERPGAAGAGRDAAEALVSLLRRSVPKKQLARVCAEEWLRSAPPPDREAWPLLRAAAENPDSGAAEACAAMWKIVKERKKA